MLEGAKEIAEELTRLGLKTDEGRAFYLLKTGQLGGTKLGRLWIHSPRGLRKRLGIETP